MHDSPCRIADAKCPRRTELLHVSSSGGCDMAVVDVLPALLLQRSNRVGLVVNAMRCADLSIPVLWACADAVRATLLYPDVAEIAHLAFRRRLATAQAPRRLQSILVLNDLLTDRLPARWQLGHASARFGQTRAHLSRVIHDDSGLTCQQWKHGVLIRSAMALLSLPALNVSEVAYSLGFEHSGQLCRLFASHLELRPSSVRLLLHDPRYTYRA